MKKLLNITLAAIISLFAVSCVQDNIEAQLDLSQAKDQVLSQIPGCTLSADGDKITATFNPAKYNVTVPVGYTLYMAQSESFDEAVKLPATITVEGAESGKIEISQKDLNSAILNMGAEADQAFTVYFKLVASALNDKNVPVEGTGLSSNIVSATFNAYSADLLDVDVYDHLWIIGAGEKVGAWAHGSVYQYLYNYSKDGNTYTGLIDYGEKAADGWKITDQPNWDGGNFGSEAQAEDPEAPSFTLINGGGSKDIKNYSKRFYMWTFDKSSLLLTKQYGFDNIGLVGTINGWNAADAATKMTYNDSYHRFYIDYTFSEDSEIKFTCDDDWGLNFGEGCAQGGANIVVPAGNYRVYLDLNNNEYRFDAGMYGKDEPSALAPSEPEEPVTYVGWGIIGVAGDWEHDLPMSLKDGVWTGYAQISAADGWKLRKDAGWDENRGAAGEVEPFVVPVGQSFEAVAGGKNLAVPTDGFYKIVYDANVETITVSEDEVWSLIGGFNDWSGDVDMTLTDGKWVSPATKISGEFKLRHNHDWNVNRGGVLESIGVAFAVENGGENISVEEGEYIVTYDPEAETVTVDLALPQDTWSLIGSIEGSSWNKDFYMTEVYPGKWVSDAVAIDGEFKIRFNNDWAENRGGASIEAADKLYKVSADGSNMNPLTAGNKYIVTYYSDVDAVEIHDVSEGLSLIGSINGTSWDSDVVMTEVSEGVFSATCLVNSEVKIRKGFDWAVNVGGTFENLDSEFDAVQDGGNIKLDEGYYTITYNSNTGKVSVSNAWSLIGGVFNTGWGSDIFMVKDAEGNFVAKNVVLNGEWKIRQGCDWAVNRGGEFASLGAAFDVVADGANIASPGTNLYDVVYDAAAEKITVTEVFTK